MESVEVIPYGLPRGCLESFNLPGLRISETWKRPETARQLRYWHLLVTFSHRLDDVFTREFHKNAIRSTRLLILLNDCSGGDRLASRLINLQIRSPERFYIAEAGAEANWKQILQSLLMRLTSAHHHKDQARRIFDARLEAGVLRIISTDFCRLEIPLGEISSLAKAAPTDTEKFEIDEDGSFLYWPELDVHLGWDQFTQIADPVAAQKAKQKSHEFNIRYGAAIRLLRLQQGLAINAVPGLSEKQLRRVERGECRLTSHAAGMLAQGHGMPTNDYLQAISAILK